MNSNHAAMTVAIDSIDSALRDLREIKHKMEAIERAVDSYSNDTRVTKAEAFNTIFSILNE